MSGSAGGQGAIDETTVFLKRFRGWANDRQILGPKRASKPSRWGPLSREPCREITGHLSGSA